MFDYKMNILNGIRFHRIFLGSLKISEAKVAKEKAQSEASRQKTLNISFRIEASLCVFCFASFSHFK